MRKYAGFRKIVPLPIKKASLPSLSVTSALSDFVGPSSIPLFHLLGESHTFLAKEEWWLLPQYEDIQWRLQNLTPLNDFCERALALATRLNATELSKGNNTFARSWYKSSLNIKNYTLCFLRKI